MTAAISIVSAIKPRRLSKAFSLDATGNLARQSGGQLVDGSLEVRAIAGLDDLASVLRSLSPAQALIYGTPATQASRVMSRKAYAAAGGPANATTRTKETFVWPAGAGVLMLDYDPPPFGEAMDQKALVAAIRSAASGLEDVAMLWWPSASSCIYHRDMKLRGVCGQRLYLLVRDAADIPRAGRVLVDRLWLAGHGHIETSKAGSLLERTLVDGSVWQPSRLDFAGGAACSGGLEQRRGDPVRVDGSVEFVDTRAALPDLTPQERKELAAIKAEARDAAEPEAQIVREEWIAARVAEMVASEDQRDPEEMQAAEAIARRALEGGILAGDFLVYVEVNGKIETLPVGTLLDNRATYHNCQTRDPLEPDYDGSRLVGRLYLMQARPKLHSQAHGGRTYKLHRAPARMEIVKGRTAEAANAAIEMLRIDPLTFDHGGELVMVGDGRFWPLDEYSLAHHLATLIQFWRYDRHGEPQDCDPPTALLKQIVSLGERRQLKPLDAVVTAPTVRPDASILDKPGYDPDTRLLLDPMGEAVPEIPMAPTMAQAAAALRTLFEPFETFPFVDAAARGAMLAALLTAVVRPALPTAPAFGFNARVQGSGKTLLAECTGALAAGYRPGVYPHVTGRDADEEIRKRVFSALRAGTSAMVWDNIVGTFDSASLAMAITGAAVSDRILGVSKLDTCLPNRLLVLVTGNNLQLAGDLPRRIVICTIDPEMEAGAVMSREFDLDPLAHTLENRMSMACAACILIRARFTHMTEPARGKLASFEAWDSLVRQTVVWIGDQLAPGRFGDPMSLLQEATEADPEAELLFALLDALYDAFGNAEFTARAILTEVQAGKDGFKSSTDLASAIRDIGGDNALSSTRSLGRVLAFREGRIVSGMRLVSRPDKHAGGKAFRIDVGHTDMADARADAALGGIDW